MEWTRKHLETLSQRILIRKDRPVSGVAKSDVSTPSFLSLPAELRNAVYDLVFDSHAVHAARACAVRELEPYRTKIEKRVPQYCRSNTFALRLACAQTARETAGYLLHTLRLDSALNCMVMHPAKAWKEILSFRKAFGHRLDLNNEVALSLHEIAALELWCEDLETYDRFKPFLPADWIFSARMHFSHLSALCFAASQSLLWPRRLRLVQIFTFYEEQPRSNHDDLLFVYNVSRWFPDLHDIRFNFMRPSEHTVRYRVRGNKVFEWYSNKFIGVAHRASLAELL